MLTVSPISSASRSQTGRPCWVMSMRARDRAGQAHDAEAEAVLAALARLLHQAARLQGAEQAERGGLVNIDLGGHLADARLAALGEDLQHADGAVDGLHSAGLRI